MFFSKSIKATKNYLSVKIAAYLESLDCEEFNAQKVANYFCLSYKHLAATFKKEKNISMQHFHQKIRIDKACKLLRTTLLSIWEIANQTGWNDQLYFSRCFKNTMGMSPTEYRNLPLTY
jgi:two-component system response regulator YesN